MNRKLSMWDLANRCMWCGDMYPRRDNEAWHICLDPKTHKPDPDSVRRRRQWQDDNPDWERYFRPGGKYGPPVTYTESLV